MRSIVLFLHLVGVVGLFVGMAFEGMTLSSLRRATTWDSAASWMDLHRSLRRVYGIASGLILLSGLFLARRLDAFEFAWVRLALGLLVLIGIAGGTAVRSMAHAFQDGASTGREARLAALHRQASRGWLRASVIIRAAMGLAAVYIMIDKPVVSVALLVTAGALVAGVVVSLALRVRPSDVRVGDAHPGRP